MSNDGGSYHREEVARMIKAWDQGRPIHTINMGGGGPGYEQAIQIAAVEIARAFLDIEDGDLARDVYDVRSRDTVEKIDGAIGGLTGAQFDAARNLSRCWLFGAGPSGILKEVAGDRAILASKDFPHYP